MSLRSSLLAKLDMDTLRSLIENRSPNWNYHRNINEELIEDLSRLEITDLTILDTLWKEYSYWMILHFKNRITKDQLDRLLDNQHIVSAMAHLLDEEQVSRVIMNGMFGLHVGDILKNNVHYKRKYGVF